MSIFPRTSFMTNHGLVDLLVGPSILFDNLRLGRLAQTGPGVRAQAIQKLKAFSSALNSPGRIIPWTIDVSQASSEIDHFIEDLDPNRVLEPDRCTIVRDRLLSLMEQVVF